ncbi:MAG TPA: hypothetical protein VMW50_05680 [Dehalococcoidia bacterium]|nr:hypothetical protein [Dehalococcoidia bacterium]
MAKIIKISKEEANRRLGDVPDEKRFWCHDGKLVKNLREFEKALNDMSDETFHYHSGGGRKDFSSWIRDVVGDEKLAKDLSKAKSRIQASKTVAQRISFLKSKI